MNTPSRRTVPRRLATAGAVVLAALVTVLGAALVTAPAASAHNVLISSSPAEGDRLETPPDAVTLTFDQPVQGADVNEVAVTGPDGNSWASGTVRVDGTVVTAPLRPLGPAGEYVIGFRVLSADGHPVSEEIRFTLTSPGPGARSPADTAEDTTPATTDRPPQLRDAGNGDDAGNPAADDAGAEDSGVPVWAWALGAIALLVIGLAVALRMGRSHEERDE